MIINNYNNLGKIGPHYERPEYRPPDRSEAETNPSAERPFKGDRSTLSSRPEAALKKTTAQAMPTGRLNLDQTRALVTATANLITTLPPNGTTQEPHLRLPSGLMRPVYV